MFILKINAVIDFRKHFFEEVGFEEGFVCEVEVGEEIVAGVVLLLVGQGGVVGFENLFYDLMAHKASPEVLLAFDKQLCGRQLAVGQIRPVLYFLLFRHKNSFFTDCKGTDYFLL
jgi:hypothetical protein